MPLCIKNKKAPSDETRGFALLVTIVLVSFLVLILVALATFTRVETQVADNSQQLAKARQNALMGLNIAIGQLQKEAGPDRRISATLGHETQLSGSNFRYITGIWDENARSKSAKAWLVSSSETVTVVDDALNTVQAPSTSSSSAVSDSANWVYLLWKNSAHPTDSSNWICLEKQPITVGSAAVPGMAAGTTPTIGHYAYWVGDEGVKASVALSDSTSIAYNNATGAGSVIGDDWSATDTRKKDRLGQFALNRTRLDSKNLFTSFDIFDNKLSNIIQQNQLLFFSSGAPTNDELKERFHYLTPLSKGVLADLSATTTYGRLKRDLSDTSLSPSSDMVNFQLARVTVPVLTTSYSSEYTFDPTSTAPDHLKFPAYPVLTDFGIRFWYSVTSGEIMLNYVVNAELWNPYATALKLPVGTTKFQIDITNLPSTITVIDNATPTANSYTVNLGSSVSVAVVDSSLTWTPGEVKLVSGSATLVAGTAGASAQIGTGITLSAAGTPTEIASITLPALANLTVKLQEDLGTPTDIQTLDPTIPYSAATATNSPTAPSFGYGFELNDDLMIWTSGDGTSAVSQADPRRGTISGLAYYASVLWNVDPSANASPTFPTQGTFGGVTAGKPIILFDIPRQEITSLGMFAHLKSDLPYKMGNTWGTDNNYYDEYFVSTVPHFVTTSEWNPESGKPLPNRYNEVYHPEDTPAIAPSDIQDYEKAAQYLLQVGSFNINSVSRPAWEAILGSRFNSNWDYEGGTISSPFLKNVFFRLPHGAQALSNPPLESGTLTTDDSVNTGGRQLTDDEIEALSDAIVDEIETYASSNGPFRTLAEFINYGIISKAIATVTATGSINNSLAAEFRGSSAALTQGDVINAIAPFINTRSDTFRIRAYGDIQNPITGDVEGRAWCEATVQRVTDMVDSALDRVTPNPISASSYFGRKFKIISFRWLTTDDL